MVLVPFPPRGYPAYPALGGCGLCAADQASSYLANFIRTGNPNGEGLPEWPEGDENHGYMVLDAQPKGVAEWTALDALMREMVIETYGLQAD